MHHLANVDMHTELVLTDNFDRARSQVFYVDRPWASLRIRDRRRFRQLNDRRRIDELQQIATEFNWNEDLMRRQMNYGLVLQRIHLAGNEN